MHVWWADWNNKGHRWWRVDLRRGCLVSYPLYVVCVQECILVDTCLFVYSCDEGFFYETVAPILSIGNSSLVAISTLTSEINFYTRLIKMNDPATDRPLFITRWFLHHKNLKLFARHNWTPWFVFYYNAIEGANGFRWHASNLASRIEFAFIWWKLLKLEQICVNLLKLEQVCVNLLKFEQ